MDLIHVLSDAIYNYFMVHFTKFLITSTNLSASLKISPKHKPIFKYKSNWTYIFAKYS